MATETKRSRIHQFFSKELISGLWKICNNKHVKSNNEKVEFIRDLLTEHEVDFIELGPGTNRFAILLDNYVFKIAMDKWGAVDNLNEFSTSYELQPYVVKTYETNGIISVCEYVTLISREEFAEHREQLRRILSYLAEGFLLGDVSTSEKNMTNWGFRDDKQLVILDYAYIYHVQSSDLYCTSERCRDDQRFLEYNLDFSELYCPVCRAKYQFTDIRRRISSEEEYNDHQRALDSSYRLTEAKQEFVDDSVPDPDHGDGTQEEIEEGYTYDYNEATASYNIIPLHPIEEEVTMNYEENQQFDNSIDSEEDDFRQIRAAQEALRRAHLESEKERFPEPKVKLNPEAVAREEVVLLRDSQEGTVSVSRAQEESVLEIHRETPQGSQDIIVRSTRKASDSVQEDVQKVLDDTSDGIINVIDAVTEAEGQLEGAVADFQNAEAEVRAEEEAEQDDASERRSESAEDASDSPAEPVNEDTSSQVDVSVESEQEQEQPVHEGVVVDSTDVPDEVEPSVIHVVTDVQIVKDGVNVKTEVAAGPSPEELVRLAQQEQHLQNLAADYEHLEDDDSDSMRNRPSNRNYNDEN